MQVLDVAWWLGCCAQVSWFAGFLIPTIAFAVAISVFLLGSRLYR